MNLLLINHKLFSVCILNRYYSNWVIALSVDSSEIRKNFKLCAEMSEDSLKNSKSVGYYHLKNPKRLFFKRASVKRFFSGMLTSISIQTLANIAQLSFKYKILFIISSARIYLPFYAHTESLVCFRAPYTFIFFVVCFCNSVK